MIHSTAEPVPTAAWESDDSICKINGKQYLAEKQQNKLPQLKHCTKRVILRSYRCTISAHRKHFFYRDKFELFLKRLIWNRYIYTRTNQNTINETVTKGT